jgi:hypothetical protein
MTIERGPLNLPRLQSVPKLEQFLSALLRLESAASGGLPDSATGPSGTLIARTLSSSTSGFPCPSHLRLPRPTTLCHDFASRGSRHHPGEQPVAGCFVD